MPNKCKDCMDFDSDKNKCLIRFIVTRAAQRNVAVRTLMNRKPEQEACEVFMRGRDNARD